LAWAFLYDYIKKQIFVRFDTTQPELEDKAPPQDPQMKLGESYEDQRTEACSPEHDEEFENA
jgi:hypothetical protein